MNLYLLRQTVNDGYDTFDSCVVAAESEDDAQTIHPYDSPYKDESWDASTWASSNDVRAVFVGVADPSIARGVICASFNAE